MIYKYMLMDCSYCHRVCNKNTDTEDFDQTPTTTVCARCLCANTELKQKLGEDYLLEMVRKEVERGIVWQGEENFSEKFLAKLDLENGNKLYNKLLSQVTNESKEEINRERRRAA